MRYLVTLLILASTSLACDPVQTGRPMAQYQAPAVRYMLVPVPMYQQPVPPMSYAPTFVPAMAYSAPRMAYSSGGGVAVSVTNQRAILPRNRGTTVSVAGPGVAVSVRSGGRAAAACAT